MPRSRGAGSRPGLCAGLACLILSLLAALPSTAARAATVGQGSGACTFKLDGPISGGEHDALAAFLGDAEYWGATDHGMSPVLCLNSPGGSLVEGTKIARFVHDTGMQTRVGDGDICHSICAIIFMMGNKHTGPTSVEQNRTLHVGGELAFHGPSIVVDGDQNYSAEQLERAYEVALRSVLKIVDLANSQRPFESGSMMHPGLIRVMLDTPATELFHIRTIEQALSWDIGLEGVPEHLPPVRTQRQMVCENGLSRDFRRPSEIYGRSDNNYMTAEVFRLAPLSGSAEYRLLATFDAEAMAEGRVYSFRYWALPVECRVGIESGDVRVCGADAHHRHRIGDCFADQFEPLPDHARYHPMTEFRALRRSGIAADVLRSARCSLRSPTGASLRSEACFQAIDIVRQGDRKFARHSLHWEGGDRTRIEIAARPYPGGEGTQDIYRIDGAPAVPDGETGQCLRMIGGNVICVTDP